MFQFGCNPDIFKLSKILFDFVFLVQVVSSMSRYILQLDRPRALLYYV